MSAAARVDVLIVSLGSTGGLRAADEELRASLQRAGARVELVRAAPPAGVPTLMLTDLLWARAARAAARQALGMLSSTGGPPRAVIYSSTTAALLWPRAGAIRFDAASAGNRPGRHGLWQRPLERRRLREAPLLLPWSEDALDELPASVLGASSPRGGRPHVEQLARGDGQAGERLDARALVLPMPVAASAPAAPERDVAAITYGANPAKKGLDRVLEAWARARRPGEELVVAGAASDDLRAAGIALPAEGVRVSGALAPAEYRALLRRARVFVCAPRREDYGIAQLEALADGCRLVTTPAPGPYAALGIARALDARLVGEDLARALRIALDEPGEGYAERAAALLAPFSRDAADAIVARELLPRLQAFG